MDSGKVYARYPSLQNRVVVVTGGAEGIGAIIVEHFVSQGATTYFTDISDDSGQALVRKLGDGAGDSEGKAIYIHCDMTDHAALSHTFQTVLDRHSMIDVLINNAAKDTRKATMDVTPEFWDSQMAVNLKHFFFATQKVIPGMKEARKGSIINIGSITWAIPATGLPAYTTCKAGIMGLTRTHAHEFGEFGIRVNSIMPGGVTTPRQEREIYTPEYKQWMMSHQALKIILQPDDVARLALFLAADDSSGITSQSFSVDAGWT